MDLLDSPSGCLENKGKSLNFPGQCAVDRERVLGMTGKIWVLTRQDGQDNPEGGSCLRIESVAYVICEAEETLFPGPYSGAPDDRQQLEGRVEISDAASVKRGR